MRKFHTEVNFVSFGKKVSTGPSSVNIRVFCSTSTKYPSCVTLRVGVEFYCNNEEILPQNFSGVISKRPAFNEACKYSITFSGS